MVVYQIALVGDNNGSASSVQVGLPHLIGATLHIKRSHKLLNTAREMSSVIIKNLIKSKEDDS